ncbi:MAG: vWA domain-containing protein [Planctomycetaceae bacterium]
MTAPAYAAPLPPNGWSEEDVQGLADLDGETITLYDARGAGRSRSTILESLQNRLDDAAQRNPRGPIVIYFNLHAAVDGRGRPCLVPPRASAVDSSTWLPVEEIFAAIANHSRTSRDGTLVVFDTNRLDVEWQLGMARNTFVGRLGTLVGAADGPRKRIPSLAVLTAAGIDEVSHTSRELGGSTFGHFLRLGLAGRADRPDLGGNGDSRVGLRELHAYLVAAVSTWSRRNRDAVQSPVLAAGDDVDFPVTWVYRTSLPDRTAPTPAVSPADVADLWLRVERLERFDPIRYAPLDWSEIRRALHSLEQAANAGSAYAATARATAEELDSRLATFERQAAAPDVDRWNVFRREDGTARTKVPARSLALRRAFGRGDGARIAAWEAVAGDLTAARLTTLADEIDLSEVGPLDEAHFLRLLAGSPAASAEPGRLGRVVALHRLGETAAAPYDERVWPWIREQVVRGDAARRLVEDAVMANDAVNVSAYETAESAYRQAVATGTSVAAAFKLLDSVHAHQIPLARWLTDPRHRRSADERSDRNTDLINAVLLPMVDEAGRLAQDLRSVAGKTENGLDARAASVRMHYERLRTEFDRAYARSFDDTERTAATLREIDLLLSIPLLPSTPRTSLTPAQQRAALSKRRAEIALDLAGTGNRADSTATPAAEPLRQMAARWQTHPLAAILAGSLSEDTNVPQSIVESQDAERLGQMTRSWLSGLSLAIAHAGSGRLDEAKVEGPAPVDGAPRMNENPELRQLVDRLRIAAALREFVPASAPNPVATLTDLDLAELLVGQAERKLADFWGPAVPGGSPFFMAAADDLKAAAELAGFDREIATSVAETSRFLERRRQAAESGIRVDVSDVLLATSDRAATAAVAVRPGTDPSSAAIPQGTAVVVAGGPGRWDLAAPKSIAVPTPEDGAEVELSIAPSAPADSRTPARVGVLFRGNLFDAPLMVGDPAGPTVEFIPPERAPTTLTLRSTHRQGLSVVFVLDCSASMAAGASSEGFGEASTRLDLARESLSRMLAELATRPDTRVGVVFYGHRVGWRKVEADDGQSRFQRSVQRDYARAIPDSVMPYNDIEVVEPLGRFDGAVAGEVETMLESLHPWGETPLYLAMDEALRQFSEADATAERSVIVITDGLNEQSNPSPAARKTPADVLATWQQRKSAIEIIGFGLSAGDAGRAADEFGRLAEATGGSYESATRATDLIAALERRIGPGAYRVRPIGGGDGVSSPIGQSVDLTDLTAMPSAFLVSLDGQESQVRAEGGEALDLIAGETGPILSARYSAGSPRFVPLVSGEPAKRSGHLLGLHRPLRTPDGGVTFEFSLQHGDQTFHARPKSVWIEVTPVGPDDASTAAPYIFFHDQFVPRTPAPVVRWTAANWPAEATTARVRFWCRETAIESVEVVVISELLNARAATSLPTIENVEFEAYSVDEADGVRIDVVERHTDGSPGVGRLAVTCAGPITPRQYIHRFDASHGVVLHTLRFDAAEVDNALDRLSLVVATRDSIERDGLRLDTPAVIDVSERSDLLVPFRSPYTTESARAEGVAPAVEENRSENPILKAPESP